MDTLFNKKINGQTSNVLVSQSDTTNLLEFGTFRRSQFGVAGLGIEKIFRLFGTTV